MENVMSPGVVKVDGAEASEVKAKAKAEGGEGNERGELGELVEGGEGGEGGGGVKLVCSLPPPYLNAELYRGQPPRPNPLPPPYQDFLYIAADGKGLLGRSDLTGRYWNGLAQTVDNPEDLLKISDENLICPSMMGQNGLSDGRFMLDTTKVILTDDAGDLMIWARQPLWSGIAKSGDQYDAWCVSCSACEHDDGISTVDLSSTGDKIVTGGNDNCIKVWDLSLISIETYRPAHAHLVSDVACHPIDPDIFLSSSIDGTVALWDSKCVGSKAKVLDVMDCSARCVCWLTDKIFAVGYENGDVVLRDISQKNSIVCKTNLNFPIHRIVYNEGTKCLAICGDSCELRVYKFDNMTSLKLVYKDNGHSQFVRGLAWDNCDNVNLYSCAWDSKILKHTFSVK